MAHNFGSGVGGNKIMLIYKIFHGWHCGCSHSVIWWISTICIQWIYISWFVEDLEAIQVEDCFADLPWSWSKKITGIILLTHFQHIKVTSIPKSLSLSCLTICVGNTFVWYYRSVKWTELKYGCWRTIVTSIIEVDKRVVESDIRLNCLQRWYQVWNVNFSSIPCVNTCITNDWSKCGWLNFWTIQICWWEYLGQNSNVLVHGQYLWNISALGRGTYEW